MQTPKNRLKARLAAGEKTRGLWLNTRDDTITELGGLSGADWCLIDGEHGPFDADTILRQLRVLAGTPAATVVRVPDDQAWMIKQVLDMGAQTIMVPMVDTAEQAKAIVAACRYPPHGRRGLGASIVRAGGYGLYGDYQRQASDETCIIVQAETGEALRNLEAIAGVDGVDGIFIGPADLGADLGLPSEEVDALIDATIPRITAAGCFAGIIQHRDRRDHLEDLGCTFTAVASDVALMQSALGACFK